MAIIQPCNHCGTKVTAPDTFAGRDVNCPTCGARVRLQTALDAEDLLPASIALEPPPRPNREVSDEKVPVRCDRCFQPYLVLPSEVDVDFDCPKCGNTFRVSAIALQAGRNPEARGTRNLKTADARDAAKLGDELLVELSSLDQQAIQGAPLRNVRRPFAWLPRPVRRPATATTKFALEHPVALAISAAAVIACAFVILYFLR